ncbi:uncharacterized protein [Triticum aestivum]|uniref:uncharacterized protein isoform X1 n=2 Tax=Triticum aestivum TaxID=4565 RepID=UPI001D01E4E2|nr:uncharacterized protein LOC123161593 isoform X1 [Triticum aestivum]XP_044435333.1 uncharacterized protein LOC123161593 isoform X1 [Triticum aestivum]XP_044435334.1 uncharacterized protein LOC123161593 isoform X1 [Triticum aestivum]XP_044435335.1 uncharacterized protein LOC123161593 isoform X1 [Triticum aestivum]
MNALNPDDKPTGGVDESIVVGLRDMLNEFNPLVQTFWEASKMIEDRGDEPIEDISIRIIAPSEGDSPQFSLPTTTGLAALVVGGGFTLEASSRDIVVCSRFDGLQQISSLNTAFMPLQYPLLFPYGERGFQVDVPHLIVPEEEDDDGPIDPNLAPGSPTVEASSSYPSGGGDASTNSRNRMTMQDYYRFMCHYKGDQPNPYICYGLLSSQSVVDARACIDESRLWYIIRNQDMLRSEHMQGITDAVGDGCVDGDALGKRTIVPSSHIGGRRYFHENFHDGLAVCRVHGAPDIFTTFTCNPKWPEITSALEPGQTPSDRADIVVRVYHMKLTEYLDDIKSGRAFGPITAVLYTVEFQKRGLPHAHILVWRRGGNGEIGVENINSLISAEIPDALLDPLGYALVSEFMMHGPCGEMNDKCVCMKKGVCSKYFPKDFRDTTVIDDNGFALYRRRDDGRRVYKNGHYLDNRHVVPYNMAMLKKFQGHINVEWCNKTQVMKYLFKYVTKGAGYSKVMLERLKKLTKSGCHTVDEVQEYLICRYICEYDALWRIFGFEIHFKMPSVQRLTVHMPGMNTVYYRAGADLTKIVDSDFLRKTMLTEWFVANEMFEDARSLTYCDFPTAWTWDAKSRSWHPRGGGEKIGRVYYVHPLSGELYYLRMLLMIVKGARSFEDLRTYDGRLYHTFKERLVPRAVC